MSTEVSRALRRSQFLRFLIVGGLAAVANFVARIVLNQWLPYAVAIVLAYLIGMAVAFLLNRRYVFPDAANRAHHQIFWFTVVNLFALLQTLLVSLLLAEVLLPRFGLAWHSKEIAHAAGIVVPVFTSFIGHKHLSFKKA